MARTTKREPVVASNKLPVPCPADATLYSRRHILAAGAAMGASALGLTARRSFAAASPNVLSGPLADTPKRGVLVWDVAGLDYGAAEYFLSGRADIYRPVSMADAPDVASRDNDKDLGARDFSRKVLATAQPFTTRLIVYRPLSPQRFSGTVIVETLHPNHGGTASYGAHCMAFLRRAAMPTWACSIH